MAEQSSYFVDSGNVVAFLEEGGSDIYSMTNRGLRIHFPLLDVDTYTVITILACCLQDNSFGPLGIHLSNENGQGSYSRALIRNYWREPGLAIIPLKEEVIHAVRKQILDREVDLYIIRQPEAIDSSTHMFLLSELASIYSAKTPSSLVNWAQFISGSPEFLIISSEPDSKKS